MTELQTTLEFSIELHKFNNVDLFQRGYYQVRISLKLSPKLPSKIEVSLPRNSAVQGYAPHVVFPACIVNGTAVSKTFQILYKSEEVLLNDLVTFRVHGLVDGHRIRDVISKTDIQLSVELWFTDKSFGPDQHKTIQCVSSRVLTLHLDPARGLHHHIPVLFDYFHLSAVSITIHATLLALCQPYLRFQRGGRAQWFAGSPRLASRKSMSSSFESVFFGMQGGSRPVARLQRACLVHWELCSLLLAANHSLQRRLSECLKLLPPWQQLQLDSLDVSACLDGLSDIAKDCLLHIKKKTSAPPPWEKVFAQLTKVGNEEDFLAVANSDVAQLCGALIVLWKQFLEVVIGQERIRQHLSRQRHMQRVKRFAEAYFVIEKPRFSMLAANDASTNLFHEVTEALRRSSYLALLPPLEVECAELDGDFNNLPVIYEEHYQDFLTTPLGCGSHSCLNLSDISVSVDSRRTSYVSGTKADDRNSVVRNSQPSKPTAIQQQGSPTFSADAELGSPTSTSSTSSADQQDRENFLRNKSGISARARVKLRTRTASLLRQLKRPHLGHPPVTLLAFRHLDALRVQRSQREVSTEKEGGVNNIRHSQSSAAVTTMTLHPPRDTTVQSLLNSESMPNLATEAVPPAPPPPQPQRARVVSAELDAKFSRLFVTERLVESCSCLGTTKSRATFLALAREKAGTKHCRSMSSCQVSVEAFRVPWLGFKPPDSRRESLDEVFLCQTGTSSKSTSGYESADASSDVVQMGAEVIPVQNGNAHRPPPPPLEFRDDPSEATTNISSISTPIEEKLAVTGIRPNEAKASTLSSVVEAKKPNIIESLPPNPPSFSCEGTMFFPKPPAEFAGDSPSSCKVEDKTERGLKEDDVQNGEEKRVSFDPEAFDDEERRAYLETKCTILEMLTDMRDDLSTVRRNENASRERSWSIADHRGPSADFSLWEDADREDGVSLRRASAIGSDVISFVKAKEEFRASLNMPWLWCSDFPALASAVPYFQCDNDLRAFSPEGLHLVICVHGLDGNSADLRLVRTYLELGLPMVNFEFLMSERNQGETFEDFETMTDRLVSEISYHIEVFALKPTKISFIGHSLGNIIIRSALTRPEMKPYLGCLCTFLSLSGPHLGTLFNNSGLVNMGMWFMQKWKKSGSLLQLSMKDTQDIRQSFLYKLSQKPGLQYFKHVLLFGSSQDRYVPIHSARIELCKAAIKDTSPMAVPQKPAGPDIRDLRKASQNWLTKKLTQLQAHARGFLQRRHLEEHKVRRHKAALTIQSWWRATGQRSTERPRTFEEEDAFFEKCGGAGNADFYRAYQTEESEVTWSAEETDMLLEQSEDSETETCSGFATGTSSAELPSPTSPIRCEHSDSLFGDLLNLAGQTSAVTFHDVLDTVRDARGCVKIAEGTHADIFRIYTLEGTSILKILNLDYIVTFWDTLYAEAAISLELTKLRKRSDFYTAGFSETKGVFCLYDCYPREFIQAWREYTSWKRSDHSHGPDHLEAAHPYVVFYSTYAGVPLTQVKLETALQLRSILQQVAASLAVAEAALQFEHRDLSLNHVLVEQTGFELVQFCLNGKSIFVNTWGVNVTVIDFALSRIKDYNTGQIIFSNFRRTTPCSLSSGFNGIHNYVADIAKGNWAGYYPRTNVVYLTHLTNQLYQAYHQKFSRQSDRMEMEAWSEIHSWRRALPEYRSVSDFVHSKFRFSGS